MHEQMLQNPEYRERRIEIERQAAFSVPLNLRALSPGIVEVPVVVHVVASTATGNISDDQAHSQIVALNRDFRAQNADQGSTPEVWKPLVADARIQFALASVDPAGNPTIGITRTVSDRALFFMYDDGVKDRVKQSSLGGVDAWDTRQYLNIWVCSLEVSYRAYTPYPGGPANLDGVVVGYEYFGMTGTAASPFNLGRTVVHEVGHWLNLVHIWGDKTDCTGTDFVDDTPPAQAANQGRPTFPHITCRNGPNGDMFMNYMDYVYDDAMVMFTQGQVARMTAALTGPRAGIGRVVG